MLYLKKKKKKSVVFTYHSTDASSTDGGLELAVQFLDCASCVETLSKQNDPIEEEKWSNAVDDILHQLYSVKGNITYEFICANKAGISFKTLAKTGL